MALSIAQIMVRFASGIPPALSKPVYYDGTDDFDKVDPTQEPSFDLADATAISSELEARHAERKAQREEAKRREADELKAKREAEKVQE